MVLFMATASASTAGSSKDPLITRSYLEGAFTVSLRAGITGTLGNAANKGMDKLDGLFGNYIRYSFAPGFTQISLLEGGAVTLRMGGSFILLSGSATLSILGGTVINISTGSEVAHGSPLTLNQRYFCTEGTVARVAANNAVRGLVDGYYLANGSSPPAAQLPFLDVPGSAWFFEAIDYVYSNALFTGTSATTFSPATPMTRAMFVTVLHRLDGRPAPGLGGGFSDVGNASLYYYDAVAWANANDIVNGYTDGTFQPDRHVTREQMAAIMYRYAVFKGRDTSTPGTMFDTFPDRGEVSGYAAHAMRWAVSWEVIRGSGGRLLPQDTATRAEVAQIIYNYCEKIGK